MNESFRQKVAPPFLYVLSVLEKISSSGGDAPPPSAIRPRIRQLMGQFDVRGPDEELHRLARSALVFWIDEVLINSGWNFSAEWRNNPLEREIYGTRSRAWRFFENAGIARGLDRTDALEVFALCVANGFQGVYRSAGFNMEPPGSPGEAPRSGQNGVRGATGSPGTGGAVAAGALLMQESRTEDGPALPPTLEEWSAAAFAQLLEEKLEPFRAIEPCDSVRTARPSPGGQMLRQWCIALGVTFALSIVVAMACL